jgi:hypothetical protein
VAIAGIVHQNVDRADPVLNAGNRGRDGYGVGDVEDQRLRASAERFELPLVGIIAHSAGDSMTVAQCGLRQCPAEAGGNASDKECLCHGNALPLLIVGSI